MTRGKGVRPFGEHVDDLVPVYFAEITSVYEGRYPSRPIANSGRLIVAFVVWVGVRRSVLCALGLLWL